MSKYVLYSSVAWCVFAYMVAKQQHHCTTVARTCLVAHMQYLHNTTRSRVTYTPVALPLDAPSYLAVDVNKCTVLL